MSKIFAIFLSMIILIPSMLGYVKKSKKQSAAAKAKYESYSAFDDDMDF